MQTMFKKPPSLRSKLVRKAGIVSRTPISDLVRTGLVWILLWPARLITVAMPIRYLARFLGKDRGIDCQVAKSDVRFDAKVEQLRFALKLATRNHPLRDTCYAEALIAHLILSLRSIDHVIFFGVRRKGAGAAMEAHAWVKAGEASVCGGQCSGDYTVVRCFESK